MLSFAATLADAEARSSRTRGARLTEDEKGRLRTLFRAHADLVWRLLRRQGLTPAQADDGLQEVFWVALERLGDLEPGRERSFLCGSALMVARRLAQVREALPGELPDTASDESLDERTDAARRRRLVFELLGKLEEPFRVVLVLQEVEGLSKRETAEALGIPEGTVASRTRRARELFRELVMANLGRLP